MLKKKILIIDDEETFGQMVKLNLEETGEYQVRMETEGKYALSSAREFKPDLIFLDVIIPDVDGGEIARQFKSEKDLKSIPIIFLTAIVKEGETVSHNGIIAKYPHPCLAKPITMEELIDCIKKNVN